MFNYGLLPEGVQPGPRVNRDQRRHRLLPENTNLMTSAFCRRFSSCGCTSCSGIGTFHFSLILTEKISLFCFTFLVFTSIFLLFLVFTFYFFVFTFYFFVSTFCFYFYFLGFTFLVLLFCFYYLLISFITFLLYIKHKQLFSLFLQYAVASKSDDELFKNLKRIKKNVSIENALVQNVWVGFTSI